MPSSTEKLQTLMNNPPADQDQFIKDGMFLAEAEDIDLTIRNKFGNTFLQCLIPTNKHQAIEQLLKRKPELANLVNSGDSRTPLQQLMNLPANNRFSQDGHKETAMLLAKYGADLSVTDVNKLNLLNHLIYTNTKGRNNKEIEWLLSNILGLANFKNGEGRTALQVLMNQGLTASFTVDDFKACAKYLAEYGADLSVTDVNHYTLLDHLLFTNVREK